MTNIDVGVQFPRIALPLFFKENAAWGLRAYGEWVRDQSGFRYRNGEVNNYNATARFNRKPKEWLVARPEVRYDWAQAQSAPLTPASNSINGIARSEAKALIAPHRSHNH